MPFCVDEILEGKVASITKFGAFVTLPDGSTGLVHISEVANTFVNDIHDHISEGQTVKVKVVSLGEGGRISLSIKKALPAQPAPVRRSSPPQPRTQDRGRARQEPESFEDKLSRFMQESNSNLSGRYNEKRSRRRGGGRD